MSWCFAPSHSQSLDRIPGEALPMCAGGGDVGKNAGRSGGRWRDLKANQRAKRLPCWICTQPINYSANSNDDDSFSVDHFKHRSTHPHLAEEPDNLRSAHLRCNKSRGDRDAPPDLGDTAGVW